MRYNIPLYEFRIREEEAAVKKLLVLLLALLLALPAAACGKEEELGPWTMPQVDTRPTPVRTPVPTFGGGRPESFVWNEAEFLNLAIPGADPASRQEKHTHRQALALFPYNFLPTSIFGESYAKYDKLTLQKTEHEVMLDEAGQLAEHAGRRRTPGAGNFRNVFRAVCPSAGGSHHHLGFQRRLLAESPLRLRAGGQQREAFLSRAAKADP